MPWADLGTELSEMFGELAPSGAAFEDAWWRRAQSDIARIRAFRAENIARGGCYTCGRPRAVGILHCERCARVNSERMKRGRMQRLANDPTLCISCAREPRRPGRTVCERCKRFNRGFLDKRKARRRAQGVCVVCGVNSPKPTAEYCQPCHEKMRVRSRRQNKYQDQSENPKRVRLTYELAQEMRARRANREPIASLAARYGVSNATVCRVVKGQIWRRA